LKTRLHTIDTILFWTVGSLLRLACILVPILYWFSGLAVMRTDLESLLWNFAPYWLGFALFLAHVSRGTNIPVLAEAMGMLTVFHALGASAVGLFGRKDQKFKVTDKGMTRARVSVRWSLAGPFLGLAALTLLGVGLAAVRGLPAGVDAGVETMNLFWSLYNVVVLSVAAIFCVERPRYRREERFAADEEAWVRASGGEFLPARLEDLSLGGCRIRPLLDGAPGSGAAVGVWIKGVGEVRATCLAADANGLRLAFLPDSTAKAALVRRIFGGGMVRPIETLRPGDFVAAALRRTFG
jgi:cellulose synthase (UDP-forming)